VCWVAPASAGHEVWAGDLFLAAAASGNLTIRVSFYSDDAVDPATDPDTGKIQDREIKVPLGRRATGVDIPLSLNFAKSDLSFEFLTASFVPTSVHVFAQLDTDTDSIELTNMQLLALELKKGR
jgi:hypothetical protein